MIKNMDAKTKAIRTLLYETTRFVDIYKSYAHIATERKLEADEKKDQKKYTRLADVFTPMAKLFGSEFCNEIAYDSLQIHGGSGYMKDYPIERIYRDARITNIYEGTTQLQVVAAIRGVSTGQYLAQINEYAGMEYPESFRPTLDMLKELTAKYEKAVEWVVAENNKIEDHNDFIDFHARRLVEMAGYIMMTYLLLIDAARDEEYTASAKVFARYAKSKIMDHETRIYDINAEELVEYRG